MKLQYYSDNQRHLVCLPYSKANLHLMAENLLIKRCWFHKDHYDIPKRRVENIHILTNVVDSKTILQIIKGEITKL